jgi:hypothetical protein
LIGAVINIAVTWCFHLHNRRKHFWMTALTSALLGLLIFLLAAMDHPYFGGLSVSPQPYPLIYDNLMKPGDSAPNALPPRYKSAKKTSDHVDESALEYKALGILENAMGAPARNAKLPL